MIAKQKQKHAHKGYKKKIKNVQHDKRNHSFQIEAKCKTDARKTGKT